MRLKEFSYTEALEQFKSDCLNFDESNRSNFTNDESLQNPTNRETKKLYVQSDITDFPNGLAVPKEFSVDVLTTSPELDTKFENVFAMMIQPKYLDSLSPELQTILDGYDKEAFLGFWRPFNVLHHDPYPSETSGSDGSSYSSNMSDYGQLSDYFQEFSKSPRSNPNSLVLSVNEFISSLSSTQLLKAVRALMLYRMPIHSNLVETLNSMNLALLHLIQCSQELLFHKLPGMTSNNFDFPLPKSKRLYATLNPSHLHGVKIHEQTEEATISMLNLFSQNVRFLVNAKYCELLKNL